MSNFRKTVFNSLKYIDFAIKSQEVRQALLQCNINITDTLSLI